MHSCTITLARTSRKKSRFGNSYGGSFESEPRAIASSCTSKVYEFLNRTKARHGRITHFDYPRLLVGRKLAAGTGCSNSTEAPLWTSAGRQRHADSILAAAPARSLAIPRRRPRTARNRTIGSDDPMEYQQRARSKQHAARNPNNGHDHFLKRFGRLRARSRGLGRALVPIARRPDLRERALHCE